MFDVFTPYLVASLIVSSITTILFAGLYVNEHFYVMPDLLNKIAILRDTNNSLASLNNSTLFNNKEVSTNLLFWKSILQDDVYKLYTQQNYFKSLIKFNKLEYAEELINGISRIDSLEMEVKSTLVNLFVNESTYGQLCPNNYDLVLFELDFFFKKTKFIYSDTLINDMIIRNNPEYNLYFENTSNLQKVMKTTGYNEPFSFNSSYRKYYYENNFFPKKIKITPFNT